MTTVSSATTTAAPAPAPLPTQGTLIGSDFQTFLKMLTTQARNQDPLNPIDSSDYAQQLATFSSVEQQVRTNSLLEAMTAQFGASGLAQFAGWVGMEAKVTAPVAFGGSPLVLHPQETTGADRAVVVTLDAAGREVARDAAPVTAESLVWAGTDASGQPLPSGRYQFRLESYAGDELIGTTDIATYARVTEVRSGAAGATVVLAGGSEVAVSAVTALRQTDVP